MNKYKVAIYLRISKEDINKNESNSISNQRDMIKEFIKKRDDLDLVSIKIDDGYSGINFDRPAFKQLMSEIQEQKVNCIIVKDLSRFGRNYLEVGEYIEKILPKLNVRLISINDNYDSINKYTDSFINLHFKNVANELYSKDISKKICSSIIIKQKNGDFIGSFPPYGYLKDPNNKNKLLIDKNTYNIIKKIFDLRILGYSYHKIAKYLDEKNISSPYKYFFEIGILKNDKFKNTKWNKTTIKNILENEVYIGNIVQAKTKKQLFNKIPMEKIKKENWIIINNMHQPIIDKNLFFNIQKINKSLI